MFVPNMEAQVVAIGTVHRCTGILFHQNDGYLLKMKLIKYLQKILVINYQSIVFLNY
jgi:hypothetical protein